MTVHLMQILLVEDSAADVRLTQEALKDAKILNELHVARDGVEAMDFLERRGDHADAPRPDIVILDLNLPRKDGKEVLAEMKGDPDLRSIPVAVLTTSDAEADVLETYDLGANCFLTKPVDLDQFLKVVQAVEEFWLGMVRLPERQDPS
ncbi:MAG TPA: response regulator [Acidimicrobiaceae bacterium]|nr:response regulator [Acidimicrobiaceae bacterium]|tara:strand:+ start:622 stop:1068 length:447 start_codon:yes stop_codon:yes gene_type:complete